MKVAVTGASGHVGNNLCRMLLERGFEVKALINKTEKPLEDLNLQKVYGNILDSAKVDELISSSDVVFHTAALISIGNEQKNLVFKVNTEGTKNVVVACTKHKVKRLVHFSSIHALQNCSPKKMMDENNPLVNSGGFNYDQSKAIAETIVLQACSEGLDIVILNPSSVVGPNDFMPSLIGQMILKLASGRLPFLVKGGYQFVDVRDVVDAAINAIEMGQSGQRYLLTSEWKSLMEIAKVICNEYNRKIPVKIPMIFAWIGLPFIFLFNKMTKGKPLYTKESLKIVINSPKNVSNRKAIIELNLKVRPIDETLRNTLSWFKKNNYIQY